MSDKKLKEEIGAWFTSALVAGSLIGGTAVALSQDVTPGKKVAFSDKNQLDHMAKEGEKNVCGAEGCGNNAGKTNDGDDEDTTPKEGSEGACGENACA